MAPPKSQGRGLVSTLLSSSIPIYTASILLRVGLLLYGLWQDANSPLKYTDIDYLVFTDAARFVSASHPAGPYARDTYRYTPLLSWMLLPTTTGASSGPGPGRGRWFSFGKVLFAAADVVAGALIVRALTLTAVARPAMDATRARAFAAIWLLNPMVATISTRGSAEGLLAVMVVALLWAVLERKVLLAGLLLGLGVHFKIYPFIYAPAIVWWMDKERMSGPGPDEETRAAAPAAGSPLAAFFTRPRIALAITSLLTFSTLNAIMYALYRQDFVMNTYGYHAIRIDHRHNFSPYNILLYLSSATPDRPSRWPAVESSMSFLPQLLLSCVLIPFVMAKKDLPATMMAQTWAFVAFNKVCTSQYFLWYLVFLPLCLPRSSLLRNPTLGFAALALWVLTQAAWLYQAYRLEFLGHSTFVPGLWLSSLAFFMVNCWIVGVVIGDAAAAD